MGLFSGKGLSAVPVSLLAVVPVVALAQQGSITFSPPGSVPIPTLGWSALLALVVLLLTVGAWHRFRSTRSGVASIALLVAALASAAVGISLIQQVTAAGGQSILSPNESTTFELQPNANNVFSNESGVDQRVSARTLPGACANADTPAEGIDTACQLGSTVAVGASCSVDCREETALSPGQVQRVDGSMVDVDFVPCGEGSGNCTADAARQACQAVGKRVVSHASDGSGTVYSLGATNSCHWSISYYNSDQDLPAGACLAGVSNLDWSSCCTASNWHGNTVPFPPAGTVFGYVDSVNGNSGYDPNWPNTSGAKWGCQSLSSPATGAGCTSVYVACTSAADP